jgi:hypothetical protein
MLTTEEATTIRTIDADGRRQKAAVLAAFFMSEQAAVDRWRGSRHLRGPFDGRMNHRMAATAKNSEPMVALSRAPTGKAWDRKPPIAPGQSQQTVPAPAKTMARIFLIAIASPRYSTPPLDRRAAIRFDHAGLRPKANKSPVTGDDGRGKSFAHCRLRDERRTYVALEVPLNCR